jgi:hypothetical protein
MNDILQAEQPSRLRPLRILLIVLIALLAAAVA